MQIQFLIGRIFKNIAAWVLTPLLAFSLKFFSTLFAISLLTNSAAMAADTTRVEYSCNEGIPLIVEFINTNTTSIAIISHDSSPKIVLENVRSGSGVRYTDGNWVLHVKGDTALVGTQGQTDDHCRRVANNQQQQHHQQAITYPRIAKSWGGIVRAGPGQHYRKKASLREGERITLLGPTGEMFQDRPWFKIKYRGRIGYHWGGIVCSVGQYVEGTYQVCN